ncbi:MAG: DNA-binding response regulator [Chloroflexi bacterium]|nr:DNA-binding response regulator [Chloroflexota bacterium]
MTRPGSGTERPDEPGRAAVGSVRPRHDPGTRPVVLIVDDEAPLVELIRGYLEREAWAVLAAADGSTALEVARRERPDVVILDLMLPGIDGIEVCRELRTFSDAYVLMLTSRAEELDKLVGLALGADDYLTKPFSPRELVARIKAVLRRPRRNSLSQAMPAGLEFDGARREVRVDRNSIALTRTEFDILAALAASPGVVVGRLALLASIWGDGYDDDHLIDVHVANLRRKLGDDPERPRFIETIRGVGYRLATT